MPKGLAAYGGEHHGHIMQRYTGLLPAVHEGRHLTVQSGYLWRTIIVERRVRGSSHRLASGVTCWGLPRRSERRVAARAGSEEEVEPGPLGH
jgi:hypothetical protein